MNKAYPYIRFSSKKQEEGNSLDRQQKLIKDSKDWLRQKGYEIDESLRLNDLGLSGYHAAHKGGSWGRFLGLVQDGKISPGSMLITEDMHRLSREDPDQVIYDLFVLKRAGVWFCTLVDRAIYDDKTDWSQRVFRYMKSAGAHEELKTRIRFQRETWAGKREKGQPDTLKVPMWLRPLINEKGIIKKNPYEFEIIPEAKHTISEIFEMYINGIGPVGIVGNLNQRLKQNDHTVWRPPPKKDESQDEKYWSKSTVKNILFSRSVIGEYQHHSTQKVEGRIKPIRVPTGKPIKNYYPPIIDQDTFALANSLRQDRSKNDNRGGGHTGMHYNIFRGLVFCGNCGATMPYKGDKVSAKSKGPVLRCLNAQNNRGCKSQGINYAEFETIVLDNLDPTELDIFSLMPNKSEIELELEKLKNQITVLKHQSEERTISIEGFYDDLSRKERDPEKREKIYEKIEILGKERFAMEEQIRDLVKRQKKLQTQRNDHIQTINNLKEYRKMMVNAKSEKKQIELRLKLKAELKNLIEKIEVFPIDNILPRVHFQPKEKEEILIKSDYIRYMGIEFKSVHNIETRRLMIRSTTGKVGMVRTKYSIKK